MLNRPIASIWKGGTHHPNGLYSVQIGYSSSGSGSIVYTKDLIMPGLLDVKYEHDGLHRLTRAQEGSGTISAVTDGTAMTIDTTLRDDRWTDPSGGGLNLSQTGNWVNRWFSESGETSATAAGTTKVAGTFSDANEQTKRVRTPNGGSVGPDLVPTYNARGDMTDDGVKYTYQYDAWGRMTKATASALVLVFGVVRSRFQGDLVMGCDAGAGCPRHPRPECAEGC